MVGGVAFICLALTVHLALTAATSARCPHQSHKEIGFGPPYGKASSTGKCYSLVSIKRPQFFATSVQEADASCGKQFKSGRLVAIDRHDLPPAGAWPNATPYWILNGFEISEVDPVPLKLRPKMKAADRVRQWRYQLSFVGGESSVSGVATLKPDFDITVDRGTNLGFVAAAMMLARGPGGPYCSYFEKSAGSFPRYEAPRAFSCDALTFQWNTYLCESDRYLDCAVVVDPAPRCLYVQSRSACFLYFKNRVVNKSEPPYGECDLRSGLAFDKPCRCVNQDGCATTSWEPWSSYDAVCGVATRVRYKAPVEAAEQLCEIDNSLCCVEEERLNLPQCPCARQAVQCQNGGTCLDFDEDTWNCNCPVGYYGLLCEESESTPLYMALSVLACSVLLSLSTFAYLGFVAFKRRKEWKTTVQRWRSLYQAQTKTAREWYQSLKDSVMSTITRPNKRPTRTRR